MNTLTFDFTGANVLVTGGTAASATGSPPNSPRPVPPVTVTGTRASARTDYPETTWVRSPTASARYKIPTPSMRWPTHSVNSTSWSTTRADLTRRATSTTPTAMSRR